MKNYFIYVLLIILTLLQISCAKPNKGDFPDLLNDGFNEETNEYEDNKGNIDPLEKINKITFVVNNEIYEYVFNPLQRGYRLVTHRSIQNGVTNLFNNAQSLTSVVSYAFTFQGNNAALKLGNFLVNGLTCAWLCDNMIEDNHLDNIGVSGVFAHYGIGKGYYLVIPITGPTNVRDLIASIIEIPIKPLTYLGSPNSYFIETGRVLTQTDFETYRVESERFSVSKKSKYETVRNATMGQP